MQKLELVLLMDPSISRDPVGQGMGDVTPPGQYLCCGHMFDVELVGQYLPAGHAIHSAFNSLMHSLVFK